MFAPTAVAPPPPPPDAAGKKGLAPVPPLLPCGGLTGGVFPVPAGDVAAGLGPPPEDPPPPEPPGRPPTCTGLQPPAPPPAVDVIVEKTELDPGLPLSEPLSGGLGLIAPPAPTVTG